MSAESAVPGAASRKLPDGGFQSRNTRKDSAQLEVFNSVSRSAKDYDELLADVHDRRPRLVGAAIDHALWRLIGARYVQLADDGSRRWAVLP